MTRNDQSYEDQMRDYKRLRDEYGERLERYENRQAELQDRWVITVAGVALAVTLSFVRDLDKPLDATWSLVASWGLLSLSVLSVLLSIPVGRVATRRMLTALREPPNQSPSKKTGGISSFITDFLNWLALLSLLLGLVAVVAFGALNLGA